jgi:hypothetical protein
MNIKDARFSIFLTDRELSVSLYFAKEKHKATPTMKRKKGKTRSVGVHPLQDACLRGGNTLLQEPGLLTNIIPAIVIPLSTSRAVYLWVLDVFMIFKRLFYKNNLFIIYL